MEIQTLSFADLFAESLTVAVQCDQNKVLRESMDRGLL